MQRLVFGINFNDSVVRGSPCELLFDDLLVISDVDFLYLGNSNIV